MSQTEVVQQNELPAAPGTLHGVSTHNRTRSAVNEEASAEIPFGVMVVKGSADDGAKLPDGTDVPMGIVCFEHSYAQDSADLGDTGLKPDTMMTLLDRGQISVRVEDAVQPGDPVRIRTVAGAGEQKGAFMTAADGTDAAVLSAANCRWITSAGAGEVAILEVDLLGATMTQDT